MFASFPGSTFRNPQRCYLLAVNYRDLSWKERMAKAREYALLLSDSELPVEDVPAQLEQMFDLSRADAERAYAESKEQFRSAYTAAGQRQLTRIIAGVLVAIVICVFYSFLGREVSPLFYILVAIAVLIIIGSIGFLGRLLRQRWPKQKEEGDLTGRNIFTRPMPNGKTDTHWTAMLFGGGLLFTLLFGSLYLFRSDRYDDAELRWARIELLAPPEKKYVSGKSGYYYALLPQSDYPARLRLRDKFYRWAEDGQALWQLEAGTALNIQVEAGDLEKLRRPGADVDVVNLGLHGDRLYDPLRRNQSVAQTQLRLLGGAVAALLFGAYACRRRLQAFRQDPHKRW